MCTICHQEDHLTSACSWQNQSAFRAPAPSSYIPVQDRISARHHPSRERQRPSKRGQKRNIELLAWRSRLLLSNSTPFGNRTALCSRGSRGRRCCPDPPPRPGSEQDSAGRWEHHLSATKIARKVRLLFLLFLLTSLCAQPVTAPVTVLSYRKRRRRCPQPLHKDGFTQWPPGRKIKFFLVQTVIFSLSLPSTH